MTDIPLKAKVFCTDGEAGTSTAVIIDPVKQLVTHVVVDHNYEEVVVPLELVTETDHESIKLSCKTAELSLMPPFKEVQYLGGEDYYPAYTDSAWTTPYVTSYPAEDMVLVEEQVPAGELAIHRGDPVLATDGKVGQVGEFVIDSESGHITHLVLHKGHLWGKKDVTLRLKLIDRVEEGIVYLSVDKRAVEQLPAVKVKRHYPWQDQ
jgi:sporulation protein YlmC with PRC-barrel domain